MANRITIKNELSFYGFRGNQVTRPRWNAIATQLNVRPTAQRFANITDNSNKSSSPYKAFVRAVKQNLQAKYTTDNQNIIQQFTFDYKIRFKEDKGRWSKWFDKSFSGQVQGRRFGINERVLQAQGDEVNRLEASNAELKDITNPDLKDPQVVPMVAGKLIAKGVRVARMKKMGALKLDANFVGDTSWDRNEDTCVFDYIYHKYAGKSGFKKSLPADDREDAYEYLNILFTNDNNPNPLVKGVSVEELKRFCERFDIGMIALDKNEKLIEYQKSNNRIHPPLIFIVSNNHFYPIEDKSKRLSVTQKNKEADKPDEDKQTWKSEDFAFEEKKGKDAPDVKVIYPNDNEPDGNEYAIKIINELKTLPNPQTLRVSENTIESFKIGETLYITKRPEKVVLKYCEKNNIKFQGQSVNSMLMDTWENIVNESEDDDEFGTKSEKILSLVNPLVHRTLSTINVKYRTHYGATRDLEELFEIIPPMNVRMKYIETEKKSYKNIFTGETIWETKEIVKYHRVVFPPKTKIQQALIDGDAIGIDINKCYSSCIYDPYDNWIKYSVEDTWEDYDGVLNTGLYYVETDDLTLLHQTNIYSNKIIELAIKEKIPLVIKKQLVHKQRILGEEPIPKNHFHKLIKTIKENTRGDRLGKLMINMICGYLGKTETIKRTAELDTDPDAIWRHYLACERPEDDADFKRFFFQEEFEDTDYNRFHKDNLILKTLEGINDEKVYLYGYESKSGLNEYTLPMYLQILDWSNMRLFELGKKVGGEIIYRHTDCIVSLGGKIPIRDMTDCWGDYSIEIKDFNFKSMMKTERHIEIDLFEKSWKSNPALKTSSDWNDIIKYAIDNGGLLIEGRAGTGKSFVPKSAFNSGMMKLNDVVSTDEYGKQTKTYADTKTMSFTNKASRGIMGTTIHKTLHITSAETVPRKTMNGLKKYKYFVIDEIGMISNDLWRYLMLLKRTNPKAIFILLGDWRQLPPIDEARMVDSDIFNHPVVKYLCNNNRIELTEKQRYNQELWDFLERGVEEGVWEGIVESKVSYDDIFVGKSICYLNKTRVRINSLCMNYFKDKTDEVVYLEHKPKQIERDGKLIDDPDDRRQSVYLYTDLPVMSWKNCVKLGIVNSEEFRVSLVDEERIELTRDEGGESIIIDTSEFHNYFLANYASTAHKSQGATYQGKVLLWDWGRMTDDKKLCYTACSRAVALNNLTIATGIK
jgi:hypothetical protein